MQSLYANVDGEWDHPLSRLLPSETAYIYATEANEHSCIVGKQSRYGTSNEFMPILIFVLYVHVHYDVLYILLFSLLVIAQ